MQPWLRYVKNVFYTHTNTVYKLLKRYASVLAVLAYEHGGGGGGHG